MAVSRPPRHRQTSSFWTRLFAQLSWYDLVLAAIPLTLVVPLLALVVFSVSFHAALATGGVLGALLVADVLFVHSPASRGSP